MSRRITTTRRNLRMSTADGAGYCVMLAFGEANIAVLGAALAMGDRAIGLLASVPPVCGAVLQLATVPMVRWAGSHKRWMVISAIIQALSFLPMAIGAMLGVMPPLALFAIATIYWAANQSCGATWNTLIAPIVPRRVRAHYFARRNVLLNLSQLIAIFAGGWFLERGREAGHVFEALAVLLMAAGASRGLSAWFIQRHRLTNDHPDGFRGVPLRESLGRFRAGAGGRVLAYRLAVQLALNVSTPFITPYLLKQHGLETDLAVYGVITGLLILAKALAMPVCGSLAKAHGPRFLLRLGGMLIIPIPALWLWADSVAAFAAVQMFSGFAMAAYELGTFLIMFDTVPESDRTSILAKFNFADNVAIVLGSLLGVGLLTVAGGSDQATLAGYVAAFVGSVLLRTAALGLLARVPRVTPRRQAGEGVSIEVHPTPGATDHPVVASYDVNGANPPRRHGERRP